MNRHFPSLLICLALGLFSGCSSVDSPRRSSATDLRLLSPDGGVEVSIQPAGSLAYQIRADGQLLLGSSQLGLKLGNGTEFGRNCFGLPIKPSQDAVYRGEAITMR